MNDGSLRLGRFWWISAVRGVFAMLLGVAVLVVRASRPMLANFIGVYWLLSGVLMVRWALTVRWRRGSRLGLAAGVLSMIAAVLVLLRQPLEHRISTGMLIDVLAIAAILMGCLRLMGAFEIERRTGRRWTFGGLALGTVEVVLGVVLFFARTKHVRVIVLVLAVWGLVGGSLLLIEGIRLRRLLHAEGPAPATGPRLGEGVAE